MVTEFGHNFKKQFGQNFLTNVDMIVNIIDLLKLDKETDTLLEIGPGQGAFTDYLVNQANHLDIVEVDIDLVNYLKEKYSDIQNAKIYHRSILDFDLSIYKGKKYKVFGALPYNISKPIINKFLESEFRPELIVFIIQKEVAQNYAATAPKSTFLSNLIQIYSDVEYKLTIPKQEFFPQPEVDGGVLLFKPKDYSDIKNPEELIKFIKNGFRTARKKLLNTIGSIYKDVKWDEEFDKLKIDKNIRPAQLTLDEWKTLFGKI